MSGSGPARSRAPPPPPAGCRSAPARRRTAARTRPGRDRRSCPDEVLVVLPLRDRSVEGRIDALLGRPGGELGRLLRVHVREVVDELVAEQPARERGALPDLDAGIERLR